MEAKEKLKKITELLFGKEKKEEVVDIKKEVKATEEIKLEQMKLDNGTVIEAESFEAGKEIFIITEEDKIPLPIGEYKLEDGRSLVVKEDGIIDSIGEGEQEEVEQSTDFVTREDFDAAIQEIKSLLTSHDEEILKKHEVEKAELSSQVKELETKLEEHPAAKKISNSPETKKENINLNTISANRRKTTKDVVWDMIFKNK